MTALASPVTVGLVVIGGVAVAALFAVGGPAVPVATAAIGGIAGWLAHGAVTGDKMPPSTPENPQ